MTKNRSPVLFAKLLAGMVAFVGVCEAQVYSWVDPATGQKRLSSIAPSWYSTSKNEGPRTVVTKGRYILDDTGAPTSERAKLLERASSPSAAGKQSNTVPQRPSEGPVVPQPAPVSRGGPKPADH